MSALRTDELGLTIRTADLSRSRPPRWAWEGRIAIGYLNLLLGNEGIGKGCLAAWFIGQLTRGTLPGELHGHRAAVGVLADEDSFDDVWTPRLHAAGADLNLVHHIERPDGGFVHVRDDRERLARAVGERNLRLLFLDALLDNLGADTDDWRQKAVRHALQPLRALARELNIAALGALHPNKRGSSFRELVAGAPAFNSVSRCSLLLAQHPEDDDVRVLVRGKGNLSQKPPALEFEIASYRFEANGEQFSVPQARDFQESMLDIDDLIGVPDHSDHGKAADAVELIRTLLPRDGQWHPAKPIKDACAEDGIDDRTCKRAKIKLGLEHRRTTTFPAATEWRWPPSRVTVGSSENTVPSVPTVPTENGQKPPLSGSWDTQDTRDTQNTRPNRVPTITEGQKPLACHPSAPKWRLANGGPWN